MRTADLGILARRVRPLVDPSPRSTRTLQREKTAPARVSGTPKFRRWITKGCSAAKAEQSIFIAPFRTSCVALPGLRMERWII